MSEDRDSSLIMGERHFRLGNYDASIDRFLEYLEDHRKSGRAWYGLGRSFLRIAEVNEAERCFDLASEHGWRESKPIGELKRMKAYNYKHGWNEVANRKLRKWLDRSLLLRSGYEMKRPRKSIKRKRATKNLREKPSLQVGFGPQRRGRVSLRTGRRR